MAPTTRAKARTAMPSVNTVPAAFEAITAEKGFTVENVVPMDPAMKIAPTTTMES